MTDRQQVIEKVLDLFIHTDNRDWSAVSSCQEENVLFDMSSMGAGEPKTIPASSIVKMWSEGLQALQHIHHQIGNVKATVSGDEADIFCYGIALHYREMEDGNNVRRFVGNYRIHLQRTRETWKIDRSAFKLKFNDGNLHLT